MFAFIPKGGKQMYTTIFNYTILISYNEGEPIAIGQVQLETKLIAENLLPSKLRQHSAYTHITTHHSY